MELERPQIAELRVDYTQTSCHSTIGGLKKRNERHGQLIFTMLKCGEVGGTGVMCGKVAPYVCSVCTHCGQSDTRSMGKEYVFAEK